MSFNAAELTDTGELRIAGSINTRLPVITDGLICHYPFDGTVVKYIPNQIRYIRDYLGYGSTANGGNHWVELQAFDYGGNNVALNKTATNSLGNLIPQFVDGSTDTGQWSITGMSSGSFHTVDLGELYFIKTIKVWHYYGDKRTYYKNKTSVSEDGVNWFIVFDGVIEGDYQETSTGHTIDLFDLGTTCKPIINANTTLTYDGIAVEEATTNLVTNPLFDDSSNWTYSTNGAGNFITTNNWGKITAQSGNYYAFLRQAVSVSVAIGDSYTLSFKVKNNTLGKFMVRLTCYGSTNEESSTVYTLDGRGNEIVCSTTKIATVTNPQILVDICIGNYYSQLNNSSVPYIYFTEAQLEKKAFATSFVNGSRSYGVFKMSNTLGTEGTINFKFIKDVIPSSGYQMPIRVANNVFEFNIRTDTYLWATTNLPSLVIGHEYTATIRWSLLGNYVKTYCDGVQTYSTSCFSYVSQFGSAYPDLWIGCGNDAGQYCFNGIIRDLSIYNRALSEDEIKQLATSTFELTPTGDLITSSITSRPNIPSDAIYFPLGFDAKDEHKVIAPSAETNTVYEDGAVWVGQATTNLITNPDISSGLTGWSLGGGGATLDTSIGLFSKQSIKVNIAASGIDQYEFICHNAGTNIEGNVYTMSAWIKCSGLSVGNSVGLSTYWVNSSGSWIWANNIRSTTTSSNDWVRIDATSTAPAGAYQAVVIIAPKTKDSTGTYWIGGAQIEKKPFSTPFINGTRGDAILKYSLPNVLTSSNDWSILIWGFPNQFNILDNKATTGRIAVIAVGNYYVDNESDTGWCHSWDTSQYNNPGEIAMFGYDNKSSRYSSSITMSLLDYSNWALWAIRYDSVNDRVYGDVIGVSGTKYSKSVDHTMNGLQPILRIGGYGWDEKTWDSYFRDLIVFKRKITDDELLSIYKDKMLLLNGTQIQNSISTGQVIL
jgi:hypothetical protein